MDIQDRIRLSKQSEDSAGSFCRLKRSCRAVLLRGSLSPSTLCAGTTLDSQSVAMQLEEQEGVSPSCFFGVKQSMHASRSEEKEIEGADATEGFLVENNPSCDLDRTMSNFVIHVRTNPKVTILHNVILSRMRSRANCPKGWLLRWPTGAPRKGHSAPKMLTSVERMFRDSRSLVRAKWSVGHGHRSQEPTRGALCLGKRSLCECVAAWRPLGQSKVTH